MVTFDVWLKDKQINELQIDLAQFMSKTESGGGKLPLDMKFSKDANKVSAPDGVTNIDVKKLMSAMGSMGSMG